MKHPVGKWLAGTALVLVAGYLLWPGRGAIRHPPGIIVPEQPVQETVQDVPPWKMGDYRITPLATFRIKARVLGKARYWMGRETDLCTYDLALGWGPMSDQAVLDQLHISQSRRWYKYRYSSPPIAPGSIESHSGNMHIISANEQVAERLADVIPGQIVSISGYLVLVVVIRIIE